MELHTLGVDGGYTQKDVIEVGDFSKQEKRYRKIG